MRPFILALSCGWLALASLPGAGCSSDSDEISDPDIPLVAANVDGDVYPNDNIGGRKRLGKRPGNRMPNFTFKAYRNGRGAGLETVSLAEYYDPAQKRNKVLHIQVAATWCAICSSELEATVPITAEMKAKGIEFLEIVVSGATAGAGPGQGELDNWVDRHKTNFPTAIDVRGRRLAVLGVNTSAMPHDILIDTRTMEILDSSVGAPLDVAKYVNDGLTFVTTSPPSTYE
jgi:hypothetical protein